MPSAAGDAETRGRFIADLNALTEAARLPSDAPLGIALSGGPDSTALLLLAGRHAAGRIEAMTVDHGLRPEATAEAAVAAATCAAVDVPHEVATIEVGRPSQADARRARYAALADWAARRGLAAVLTAHHADDQAETVLMRLARGSGLAGLSGIRPSRVLAGKIMLLRPLLGWRRTELAAIVAAAGIEPVRDPSNADPRFARTVARTLLAREPWLDGGRVAASASYIAEAEAALNALSDERYEVRVEGEERVLTPDPIAEIARRHLVRLLAEQFDAAPDGPALQLLLSILRAGGSTCCADVLCRADGPVWRFRRAPPRRGS